ncbi:MAG: 1,4-alpha-glucan branching protein GlgB [Actinomycetes bacterium]
MNLRDTSELDRIVDGSHHNPHDILGAHSDETSTTIRILRPLAKHVDVVVNDELHPAVHEHRGIWQVTLNQPQVTGYTLLVQYDDEPIPADDAYRFLPTLGQTDLYLISEGRHEKLWTVLGAHVRTMDGVSGISFAVWAPNAQGLRVMGDFNHWDGAGHPMRSMGASGVWELFVPLIAAGTNYKFAILGHDGLWRSKADPMAFAAQVPPENASVVFESTYRWKDNAWMVQRAQHDPHNSPMSTYEVHLGSWRKNKSYRDLADELVEYVVENGFTHVELMPVAEHPYAPSWGYQVTSYYAPTSRFGNPDDFRFLVDAFHQAGIGVIVDWVPAHFPKDAWALSRFDGTALYEHEDPRRGEHPDWGTLVFDFGRAEVRNFLVANALYFLEEFHIDGLRVDAVASMLYLDYSRVAGEWVPNKFGGRENLEAVQFLQELNATVYARVPGVITIAEESTAWQGVTKPTDAQGLGFGLKWNMGWMHDTLSYMSHEPVHRQFHHNEMTFPLMYAWSENFVLPISHDEVVHGKGSLLDRMSGDAWQKLAHLRAYLAYMWAHPGKKLIFMGCEFAQPAEWSQEHGLDWWVLDQPGHQGVARNVQALNRLYRTIEALWERDNEPEGFQWIVSGDTQSNVFAWARYDKAGNAIVSVTNFSPIVRNDYQLGVPSAGEWHEVMNTDSHEFGGSGIGNLGDVVAHVGDLHGMPAWTTLTLPPLATVWLRHS